MSITWEGDEKEQTWRELQADWEQEQRNKYSFTTAVLFALLCSVPWWAGVIWRICR